MNSTISILLVEDDQVDVMTIKRAFSDIHITNPVSVCENGVKALEYLQNPENEIPGIILLDLNMPKMNGIEFLQEINKDSRLKLIPVVVLTTSKEEQDKIETYKLGVAGYMIKPVDYLQFVEIIRTIHLYWTICELPNSDN